MIKVTCTVVNAYNGDKLCDLACSIDQARYSTIIHKLIEAGLLETDHFFGKLGLDVMAVYAPEGLVYTILGKKNRLTNHARIEELLGPGLDGTLDQLAHRFHIQRMKLIQIKMTREV